MYRSKTRWCKICQVWHPSNASRFQHRPPVYYEPKDFDEYVMQRLDNFSKEAKEGFDIHPEQFQMMRTFWHTQWLDAKGKHDEANEERTSLYAILNGTNSAAVPELVMA